MSEASNVSRSPYFRADVIHEGDSEHCAYHVTELRLWGEFRVEVMSDGMIIRPADELAADGLVRPLPFGMNEGPDR